MTEKERIAELQEQLEDAKTDIKILEEQNEELQKEADELQKDGEALGFSYDLLGKEFDELSQKYDKLTDDSHTVNEVIEKIHGMVGNGITSGDFKRIADMLATEYSIKTPIAGLDY